MVWFTVLLEKACFPKFLLKLQQAFHFVKVFCFPVTPAMPCVHELHLIEREQLVLAWERPHGDLSSYGNMFFACGYVSVPCLDAIMKTYQVPFYSSKFLLDLKMEPLVLFILRGRFLYRMTYIQI